jgi:hypothetical protein
MIKKLTNLGLILAIMVTPIWSVHNSKTLLAHSVMKALNFPRPMMQEAEADWFDKNMY